MALGQYARAFHKEFESGLNSKMAIGTYVGNSLDTVSGPGRAFFSRHSALPVPPTSPQDSMTLSRTPYANLDRVFVKNTFFFIEPTIGGRDPLAPPILYLVVGYSPTRKTYVYT